MSFNNVIDEYLKYFFVIGNMSIYKSIIKFVIFLTSLIIKSAQPFKKIHIFYKILGLLEGAFFVKGKYFFVVGALGLDLSCLGLGPGLCTISIPNPFCRGFLCFGLGPLVGKLGFPYW